MAYQNMVGQFIYETPTLRFYFDQLAENDSFLKSNGWQDSVKVVFYQASVPTGWTQDASQNDKFLRVVNNTGGNPGGAVGGSIAVSAGINLAHTHTMSSDPAHTHTGADTHASRHTPLLTGLGISGSTVSLSKSPVLYGIGNTFAQFNQNGSGSTGPGNWGRGTAAGLAAAVSENVATSSAGSHNHTLGSSLGSFNPAYTDVIIGIKSTSSGYTDLTNFFNHNDRVRFEPFNNAGGLWFNDDFNNNRLTPSGTVSMFYNASAPAGWNKLTTENDKALRIVSGAGGGSGGTLGTGQNFVVAHNHSNTAAGSHSHTTGGHRHDVNAATGISARTLITHATMNGAAFDSGTGTFRAVNFDGSSQSERVKGRSALGGGGLTTGTQSDHTHTIGNALSNFVLAYVDMIQCQKLSTGAPHPYTSLLGLVVYKKLVSKQRLDSFGKNDEYIRYHTMPAGSIMAFFQSTIPLNWTLVSAQHDKVLRIVTGAGGGSGGNQLISQTINLAHTHTISTHVHSHSIPSHAHDMDVASDSVGSFLSLSVISSGSSHYAANHQESSVGSGDGAIGGGPAASPNTHALIKGTTSVTAQTLTQSHNHGGSSGSALGTYNFAYANVILCQKN